MTCLRRLHHQMLNPMLVRTINNAWNGEEEHQNVPEQDHESMVIDEPDHSESDEQHAQHQNLVIVPDDEQHAQN